METKWVRNFCIISHVDHGKSTLADRFLEFTNTITKDKMKPQYLDLMPLERERGITIKLQPVTMKYSYQGEIYTFNLIDTPGHVDFSYEVSRSLAAVEGAILLVDISQGIQAQTLANLHLAKKQGLTIIPVVNKIDLPNFDLEAVKEELANLLNIDKSEIICISAKKGIGIEKVLEAVIENVPEPKDESKQSFQALIFDSHFDEYKGVLLHVRVFKGVIKIDNRIKLLGSGVIFPTLEVGVFSPSLKKQDKLEAGDIGYIVTGLKEIEKCRVGDTAACFPSQITALEGYKEPQPMVFASIYPKEGTKKELLRQALSKLKLNDASLTFEPIGSVADQSVFGMGFRVGFLGLLHLDIVKERLKREYGLDLVITSPSVSYNIKFKTGKSKLIYSPTEFPDPSQVDKIEEPWVKIDIVTPITYIGSIMELLRGYLGIFLSLEYISGEKYGKFQRAVLHYEMPLALLLVDFYDKLKSITSGYTSYSYDFMGYRPTTVVKLDILVAGDVIEQLSSIVYRDWALRSGRRIVGSLKEILPRQLFEVKLQAAVGGKILASEKISPLRKDVTAKLYGGDVTRKNKLLDKQKKGKQKMARLGKVDIPPEAYLAIIKK
ncbi:MAG: translation elongation factor 4 [Patescibacteria group bacterium]